MDKIMPISSIAGYTSQNDLRLPNNSAYARYSINQDKQVPDGNFQDAMHRAMSNFENREKIFVYQPHD